MKMRSVEKSRSRSAGPATPAGLGEVRIAAKPVSPQRDFDLTALLGEAGWRDADQALAACLRDFGDVERASADLSDALDDALLILGQSLAQAARRRGLKRFGAIGAVEAFDPNRHELVRPAARAPALVKVTAEGVARGEGPGADILIKALVTPSRARRSS
jgi:hypothetical protein